MGKVFCGKDVFMLISGTPEKISPQCLEQKPEDIYEVGGPLTSQMLSELLNVPPTVSISKPKVIISTNDKKEQQKKILDKAKNAEKGKDSGKDKTKKDGNQEKVKYKRKKGRKKERKKERKIQRKSK